MKKEEIIERYSIEEYNRRLEKAKSRTANWRKAHPEKVKANDREKTRKTGKYYEKHRQYQTTGIPHNKKLVRGKHQCLYMPFKQIIAPESELHHSWLNDGSAAYSGVALVEKYQHRHGYIDVIQILEGEITLLTEAGIRTAGEAQ